MSKVHFIGIGGTGISAIALLLLEKGWQVSGTDKSASRYFDAVTAKGAYTLIGHSPELALKADLIVRSSAVRDDDPEVLAAREKGIPVLKRNEFLPNLTAGSNAGSCRLSWKNHLHSHAGDDAARCGLGSDLHPRGANSPAGHQRACRLK